MGDYKDPLGRPTRQTRPPDPAFAFEVAILSRKLAQRGQPEPVIQQLESQIAGVQEEQAEYEITKTGDEAMSYSQAHNHKAEDAIFTWAVQSSRVGAGGRSPKYEMLLYADGCVSCDCPGWMFHKPKDNSGKSCKHTRMPEIVEETIRFVKMHKRGETLPTIQAEQTTTKTVRKTKPADNEPKERYGRVLEV